MWLLDSVWIWGLSAASIVAVPLLERRESQRGGWVPVVSAGLALLRALLGTLTFEGWEYAGHGWLDNAVTFGAHLFLMGVPALAAGLALACSRLRRRWVKAVLILAFLAVFPFFSGMQKDGGSRTHSAVLYDITFLHRLPSMEGQPYETGTEVRPFHLGEDSRSTRY